MRLLVLLITRIGKRIGDCGKQETCDLGAIFLSISLLPLSPSELCKQEIWQCGVTEPGHFQTGSPQSMCGLSELVAKRSAGKNCFCSVLEPVDVLHALT